MPDKILAKDKIAEFVAGLQKEHQVFAPALSGSTMAWEPLDKAEDLVWEFSNTDMSPKDFFFPPNRVHDDLQEQSLGPRGNDHAR